MTDLFKPEEILSKEAPKDTEIKVDEYQFEKLPPIKGFPELRWRGKVPYKYTRFFPAQLKETYGEADESGWLNKIFWGDNLQVMSHLLKKYRGKVDLVYIDPPFDSKADYKKTIELRGKKTSNDHTAFEEKQYGDMWNNDEYLQFMYERLILLRELLSDKGSIFLHCDWHKSHHLRCLMDEVFGGDNFRNEIVWKYETGGIPETFFSQKHDVIFFYSKSSTYTFNKKDASFPRNICQNCGQEMDKWNNLKKLVDENGRVYRTIKSNGKIYKYYDDEPVLLSDVWMDISHIQQKDPQRVDYPTQKPEALIERIIKATSNPGDLVFDCFMGSGTTQAAAFKLGRRFIGADINLGSIETAVKRLIKLHKNSNLFSVPSVGFEVYNVNNYEVFRNPIEAKDILIDALEINRLGRNTVFDGEKDGFMVKVMPVNRIANREDLNEIINNIDQVALEKAREENPTKPVMNIRLVCMGHEPDLGAQLVTEFKKQGFDIKVEVYDILRSDKELEFKHPSEAHIVKEGNKLVIKDFFPMNLLQKLSIQKENVEDWKELVESVKIDWNYDGAVFQPTTVDYPENKKDLVGGSYEIPSDASIVKVKITDLLSESFETELDWSK
ncbi:MAG: site-specific DNA-methyltransferase [Alphaproteobacteria bacterium]|nr:site-specific DNA-methyltransferase [Alphaproteobacteria bacterium]